MHLGNYVKTKKLRSCNLDALINMAEWKTRNGDWEVDKPIWVSWLGYFVIRLRRVE
jgi:hypothetical protein